MNPKPSSPGGRERWTPLSFACGGRHSLVLATPRSHEAPPRQPPLLHPTDTGRVPSQGDRGGAWSQQGGDLASGPGSPSGRGSGGGGGGGIGGGGAKGSLPRGGGGGRGYKGQCVEAFEVVANAVDTSFGGAACEPFQADAVEEVAEAGEWAEAEVEVGASLVSAASFSFSHQGSLGEAEAEAAVEVAALLLLQQQQAADAHLALLMAANSSSAAADAALAAACTVPPAAPAVAAAAQAVASGKPCYAAALMRGQVTPSYSPSPMHTTTLMGAGAHPSAALMGAGAAPMDLPPIATILRASYSHSAGDKPAEGGGMAVGIASLPIAVARGRLASEAGDTTSEDDGEGDGEDDSSDEEEGAADVRGSSKPLGGEESDVLATDDPQVGGRGGEGRGGGRAGRGGMRGRRGSEGREVIEDCGKLW